VDHIERRLNDLSSSCVQVFRTVCKAAESNMKSDKPMQFEEVFFDYQAFAVKSTSLHSKDGQEAFTSVNKLAYHLLQNTINRFRQTAKNEVIDFAVLRKQLIETRAIGTFFADNLTLLYEQTKSIYDDPWLNEIVELSKDHFKDGRDLSKLKQCAILGVRPSATEKEIKSAYRAKAKLYHPDKSTDHDSAKFRAIKEAEEALLTMKHLDSKHNPPKPFSDTIFGLREHLRRTSKRLMEEQQYQLTGRLLFNLPGIKGLAELVTPTLECDAIIVGVYETVTGAVEKRRIDIDSMWNAREYRKLNDAITDLKAMQTHLGSYPRIFSSSWDQGVTQKVEAEITSLGEKCQSYLESHTTAKGRLSEFRRIFLNMGSVMVELPSFKDFTKSVMLDVLESCLNREFGHGYLFELGLKLQKSDESCSADEKRVAQMIIAEFSHFKEVQTMIWNEETAQKPAEDVVAAITGEYYQTTSLASRPIADLDTDTLLANFEDYDQEYKSLLADYLNPNADLNVLVHKTIALADKVKPNPNSGMEFGQDLKDQIPTLLASLFALFTVLKSGASYNRIESESGSSELGSKLLMKPHNIQVGSFVLS
jgi:DnaJ-domain-containing protein 1